MASRTEFPYLVDGDYNLGVRAMQVCVARALQDVGKPTVNARNGAYGDGTRRDLVKFKQYHNLRDVNGRINPHVFGKSAWLVAWRYATSVENGWVVTRLKQIREAEAAAKAAALQGGAARARLVAAAEKFLAAAGYYTYAQIRPAPVKNLYAATSYRRFDCSSTVIALYYAAGVKTDPSGYSYQGWGDTGALWRHGARVTAPLPGDLAFYGWESRNGRPQHVAMHLGGGDVVTFGSTPPRRRPVYYRTDYIGSRSYL